ncbi:MAG: hypothetical protein KDA77_11250, partial [Planctomycetaceae bacterium]|nr:hypothetical protein [Planctomycetaceae bacterium]
MKRLTGTVSRQLRYLLAALMLCGPTFSAYADSKPGLWSRLRKSSAAQSNQPAATTGNQSQQPVPTKNSKKQANEVADISLNHVQATWGKVLTQVAEQSELTLVMDVVPKGFYSRIDKKPHTLSETFQILNRELEPKGFRLLQKDQFLIVLDLRQAKSRYVRATVQTSGKQHHEAEEKTQTVRQVEYVEQAEHSEAPVKQVEAPATFDKSARQLPQQQAKPQQTLFTVRPRTLNSTEILRLFYHAFESRAELQGEGPNGFPGVVVYAQNQQSLTDDQTQESLNIVETQIDFRVGLDKQNNELIFEATVPKAHALKATVLKLDQAAKGKVESIQLVTGSPQIGQVAQALHKQTTAATSRTGTPQGLPVKTYSDSLLPSRNLQIDRLRQLVDQIDFEDAQPETAGQNPQQPQPAEKPAEGVKQPSLPELLQDLSGNVNIESVPDLGVLILRGKDEDVNALMKIIKELEKLSEGTRPDIHLLNLRHVNSTALADLLNGVYEDLVKLRAIQGQIQKIKIIPLVKPNALLILAPDTDMPSILKLAEELDQPVNPQTEFGVFELKSASASQVATTLKEFYNERGGLGTRILVSANIRTNSIIVQAQPRDMQEVAALIQKIDQDQSQAVSRVKIFPLTNAIAADLAETLNSTLQSVLNPAAARTTGAGANLGGAGGEAAQQLQEARSVVLEYLAQEGTQSRVLRSGLLADIRVIADPRANSLVVTAPNDSLELVGALIKQFDQRVTTVAELKVFTLKNADAQSMVTLLQATFSPENQQTDLGIQIAGVNDANSNLIPLNFTVDRRTNSVVAQGGADALQIVEAILLKLDGADSRKR